MDTKQLLTLAHLSEEVLVAQVKQLAAREREATVALIAHLAELDQRRLYLAEGCSSLFTYCTQVLHLSEHAAYGRIEAARAARRFPVILGRLEEGAVTLTTVGLLAAYLTEENHRELLDAACHRSKRQVEELVAWLRPQPPVPASIRRLPAPRPSTALPSPEASPAGPEPSTDARIPFPLLSPAAAAPTPTRPAAVVPLAPERFKVQFTASAETCEKLRLAQALLRHQIPDGDPAAIFDRALTVLLEGLTKQKWPPRTARGNIRGSSADLHPARATSPQRSSARSGDATLDSAPSSALRGVAAPSGNSWNSITSCPARRGARHRSTTSSSGAARTMVTKPSESSAHAGSPGETGAHNGGSEEHSSARRLQISGATRTDMSFALQMVPALSSLMTCAAR